MRSLLQDSTQLIAGMLQEASDPTGCKVVWTDREYNSHSRSFKTDPLGPPENANTRAMAFKKALEAKDAKSKFGNLRTIKIVPFEGKS